MTAAMVVAAQSEMAVSADRAQIETARVQARYLVAMKCPRNMEDVRTELLKECSSPEFAEEAMYLVPVGENKKASDLSIRFAEAAISAMGNMDCITAIVRETDEDITVNQTVFDLQKNVSHSTDITISKTKERQKVYEGEEVLGSRTNSYGKLVYTVRADETSVKRKIAAEVSKALRTNTLRHVPAHIKNECKRKVKSTTADEHAKDPREAARRVIDNFSAIGVTAADLTKWRQTSTLDGITAQELDDLRATFTAIRDGNCTWRDVMAARGGEEKSEASAAIDKVKDKIAASRAKKATPKGESDA